MRAPRLCAALVLLAAGACGQEVERTAPAPAIAPAQEATTTSAVRAARTPPTFRPAPSVARPPLLLRAGGRETSAGLWSACWSSGNSSTCADGRPPATPLDIGSPPDIEVAFDTPGWRFSASFVPTADPCGRQQSVDLDAVGPTTHRLRPFGPAGDYTVTLGGHSTDSATNRGDVATTFRWRTTSDGPNEPPSSTMSLLPARPELKISLGATFRARGLGVSTQPGEVQASAVVTAANGASMAVTFGPYPREECVPDGMVSMRSDGDDGKAVAGLGPAPYRYAVTLVLHGVTHRGTGIWPQDEIDQCSPCTRLRWDPPLPAL